MTTYNTGNPIGSTDARDLYDNAQNLDNFSNGSAASYTDRLGVSRRSLSGIDSAADNVLNSIGYAVPVAYAGGISLTLTSQTVDYNGVIYAPKSSALPFTTSSWGTDSAKFRAIQVTDADLITYTPAGTGAVATTVQGKLRESVSVKDFGAAGTGDDTVKIQAAMTAATGVIKVQNATYSVSGNLTLGGTQRLSGEQPAVSKFAFSGTGVGILANGTNGTVIENLNFTGSKSESLVKLNNCALFKLSDLISQNNQSSVIRLTGLCQDAKIDNFDFLQCGGVYPASPSDGAVVYYGATVNNIYSRYGRFEAPRNTAIYVDGANTIRYIGGKIDGSFGGVDLTSNPFVVANNGDISFTDYTVTGFKSYPFEVAGYGQINFEGIIGNGLAPAIFKSTSAAYDIFLLSGGRPGVIRKPSVKAKATVGFSSENTAENVISSVISLKAPSPLMKPNPGNNGIVRITGAFDTGGGLFQAAFEEWNGSAYAAPSNNDSYTGGWLVDKSTGNAFAQITTQSGGLCQFRVNGLTSTGSEHFIQYDNVHGVRVDIQIEAPAYSQSRWTTQLAEVHATVTTTATSYSSTTGLTTVQLSAPVTNDTLIGYFLHDSVNDKYYYISGNSGSQLLVMHDRTAVIPNGSYKIVKGNPKAGAGITLNWV